MVFLNDFKFLSEGHGTSNPSPRLLKVAYSATKIISWGTKLIPVASSSSTWVYVYQSIYVSKNTRATRVLSAGKALDVCRQLLFRKWPVQSHCIAQTAGCALGVEGLRLKGSGFAIPCVGTVITRIGLGCVIR